MSGQYGYDAVEQNTGYVLRVVYGQGEVGPQGIPGQAGPRGTDGVDGKSIELRATDDEIQWRRIGDDDWNKLAALNALVGPKGEPGIDGENGSGVSLKGQVAAVEDLPGSASLGDAYLVGSTVHLWGYLNGAASAEWIVAGDVSITGATLEELARKGEVYPRQSRPGEKITAFTDVYTGDWSSGVDPAGTTVATAEDGNVRRITGQYLVATRERTALEAGRLYELRAKARRTTDPSDPANDAVTVHVRWLDENFASVGTQTLHSVELNTSSDDLMEFAVVLADQTGTLGDPDDEDSFVIWPSGAVYAVPYIRTYGADSVTDVIHLELRDISHSYDVTRLAIPTDYKLPPEIIPGTPVDQIVFVSTGGDDADDGSSLGSAVATLERAMEIVEASPVPMAVHVWPGTYTTDGHIDVPDNCTGVVAATNTRSTKIVPTPGNEVKNVFRLGDGGYVEGFSFEGWQVDDLEDPTEGFAISFRPGAEIYRTVFAFNITVFRGKQASLIEAPLDRANGNPLVGNGPGVALADAAVVSPYSVFPQIMLWGATPVSPNGIGYCAKNGAFLNGINAVALWMHKHYMALKGGEVILTNCASQFGDYSLWSEGSCLEIVPVEIDPGLLAVDTATSNIITNNADTIVDEAYTVMTTTGGYVVDETKTKKDSHLFLKALAYDFATGTDDSMKIFQRGMFDFEGKSIIPGGSLPAFTYGWNALRDRIIARGITAAAIAQLQEYIDALVQTVTAPETRPKPSKITSVGHQWNNVLAGVNGRALFNRGQPVPDSVVERDLGIITFAGIDDTGRQYFSGGALVNPNTGQLEGPPIDRTIFPRARRAALIAGGQI